MVEPQCGQKWNRRVAPLSAMRSKTRASPAMVTCSRGKKAATPKALPVRFWQSVQWQTEIRTGSPAQARVSFPQEQAEVLKRAVPLVRPGGRIAYVTCSVLEEENGAQIRDFIGLHPDFSVEKPAEVANALGERAYMFGKAALVSGEGVLMTPRRTDTDGFFVSILRRSA